MWREYSRSTVRSETYPLSKGMLLLNSTIIIQPGRQWIRWTGVHWTERSWLSNRPRAEAGGGPHLMTSAGTATSTDIGPTSAERGDAAGARTG
jgi:hypothetical protein